MNFDIAIIGGGNAGLSLARNLFRDKTKKKIIVIEPELPDNKVANWCTWMHRDNLPIYKKSIKGSWEDWTVSDKTQTINHSSASYKYVCIDASMYLSQIENELHNSNIQILRDSVVEISEKNNRKEIICKNNMISSIHVYDSRPPEIKTGHLRQHFYGIEFEFIEKHHINSVILMDFDVTQSSGLHFIYALPLSERKLFVESTVISKEFNQKQWYEDQIELWMENKNLDYLKKLSYEEGVIAQDKINYKNEGIHFIGARGGAVRLSSGYTFHNIQSQAAKLADNIRNDGYDVPVAMSKFVSFMDRIFNKVLINEPQIAVDLFLNTTQSLSADEFAKFMLNKANFNIWSKVIAQMPKTPFIRQAFKSITRG